MRWYFLSIEYHLFQQLKSFCFEIFGDEKYGIFEPKSWWRYDIYWLQKSSCFDLFGNWKYGLFLGQTVYWKVIFTDYWKGLVLNFSVMENMVFFWVKKSIERWCLVVTEKFLFWTFQWWEMRSFFQSKSWRKDDIYMVFLSFLWYFRTWKMWKDRDISHYYVDHLQRESDGNDCTWKYPLADDWNKSYWNISSCSKKVLGDWNVTWNTHHWDFSWHCKEISASLTNNDLCSSTILMQYNQSLNGSF